MARPIPTVQQRALSLTEELERLEQSITLTLQEIDHNFSKAHRIVTSSIIPVVEQYAAHSRDVWEGSRFWKQFFESSANVSLSGYEEQPSSHETLEETVTEESNATTHTTLEETSNSYDTPSAQHISTSSIQDLDLSNLTISPSHSTPRPTKKPQPQSQPKFSDYISPYEALRQEVQNTTNIDDTNLHDHSRNVPTTPNMRDIIDDVAMTPQSSPALPRISPNTLPQPNASRKNADPLLHRVLDKTYRIQATPMTANRLPPRSSARTPSAANTRSRLFDNDLSSSPEIAPPQLHAEVFASPERKSEIPRNQPRIRTPGVSVLTPARGTRFENAIPASTTRTAAAWDSDDEDDSDMPFGASPPKTMQFHVPQSRLLKTPAHEASKRIVEGILETAGMTRYSHEDDTDALNDVDDIDIDIDVDLDDEGNYEMDPNSPSVVRKAAGLEDETF